MHALVSDFGRGLVDLEHLHEHSKQLSCCHRIVQIVFAIHVFVRSALDFVIVLLILNGVLFSGTYFYYELTEKAGFSLNFVLAVFDVTEEGEESEESRVVMAHYLLFISMVVDTTWLCSAYMFDRLSLIHREETINCGWSARCLKIMTSLILVLNPWMKTRYGYHFCMYYLINKLIHFILLLLPLLNQLMPGTNEITFYCSYCKLY